MQLPAIREEEERRSLIQDKEVGDGLLTKEPIMKKKRGEEGGNLAMNSKRKSFPLQDIWQQFEKQEEEEGQELLEKVMRKGWVVGVVGFVIQRM